MATHYDIASLATVASTQDEARRRLEAADGPVLVVAERQVAGRGRQGREWSQPDRGMYASVAFITEWETSNRTLVPLIAAVAVQRVVLDRFDIEMGLKWPNDLFLGHEKVGGILVEAVADTVVVGCGLNLWWEDPIDGATALFEEDPGAAAASGLAEAWTVALLEVVGSGARAWPRAEYERASMTLGEPVYWDEGHGRAVAIAPDGALVVESEGERIELHSGEVHTRHRR